MSVTLRGFGWRHAGRKAWAVRGVDLRVERGERVLLLGPSGAGKSTLLAALGGLLAQDSGEQEGSVAVDGVDPRWDRAATGTLFQDPQTQLVMARVGDDVAFGLENRGVPASDIWPRVDEALRLVDFGYHRDHRTDALSGGEQQRVALAGVLAMRPSLLLLDEPTANLDPAGAELIRSALARALRHRTTTLILVEHRVADALPLIDRVVVLEPGGGVRADGSPGEIFHRYGEDLAASGVWVPGRPVAPRHALGSAGVTRLTAHGVTFRHPGTGRDSVSGIDIEVRAGQALAVVGGNGAGKSTLALLLGGLLPATSGHVVADPTLAAGLRQRVPARWPAAALAVRIGSVFQNPEHQFVTSKVYDELALGPRRTGIGEAGLRSTVDGLLARLRLDRLAEANPYTLSGGEQRRLSVATALATAPPVLILDEPTFGQDRRTWIELVDLLAGLRDAGTAVVSVTHDEAFVEALADRTVTLAAGGLAPASLPATREAGTR